MAGRPPSQTAKNDARQQLRCRWKIAVGQALCITVEVPPDASSTILCQHNVKKLNNSRTFYIEIQWIKVQNEIVSLLDILTHKAFVNHWKIDNFWGNTTDTPLKFYSLGRSGWQIWFKVYKNSVEKFANSIWRCVHSHLNSNTGSGKALHGVQPYKTYRPPDPGELFNKRWGNFHWYIYTNSLPFIHFDHNDGKVFGDAFVQNRIHLLTFRWKMYSKTMELFSFIHSYQILFIHTCIPKRLRYFVIRFIPKSRLSVLNTQIALQVWLCSVSKV